MAFGSLTLLNGDLDDPIFVEALKILPANIAAVILVFVIVQKRELKRFLD